MPKAEEAQLEVKPVDVEYMGPSEGGMTSKLHSKRVKTKTTLETSETKTTLETSETKTTLETSVNENYTQNECKRKLHSKRV